MPVSCRYFPNGMVTAATALPTWFTRLSLGRKWVVLHSPPPSTKTRRRISTMMLSQLTRFAKRLWARLPSAAHQVLRHLTHPASSNLVTGTLADLPRRRSELLAENALLRQQLIVLHR